MSLEFIEYGEQVSLKSQGEYLPRVRPQPVVTHTVPGDISVTGRHTGATSRQYSRLLLSLTRAMSLLRNVPLL